MKNVAEKLKQRATTKRKVIEDIHPSINGYRTSRGKRL